MRRSDDDLLLAEAKFQILAVRMPPRVIDVAGHDSRQARRLVRYRTGLGRRGMVVFKSLAHAPHLSTPSLRCVTDGT